MPVLLIKRRHTSRSWSTPELTLATCYSNFGSSAMPLHAIAALLVRSSPRSKWPNMSTCPSCASHLQWCSSLGVESTSEDERKPVAYLDFAISGRPATVIATTRHTTALRRAYPTYEMAPYFPFVVIPKADARDLLFTFLVKCYATSRHRRRVSWFQSTKQVPSVQASVGVAVARRREHELCPSVVISQVNLESHPDADPIRTPNLGSGFQA
ncbi:hypothetical protein GALMADRAFT_229649 [Galerina marginata CBS 339.88]|uniref:Uncharacterized protein n=1 Tax=Galerina marginata (strain CBS 339.88) TaxID=685588 RepID=A0A067SUB5_GALM3|nr:hypothetical protein GALMADRAFT_229649 [Galerina marginata CBS 339.88]